MSPVERVRISRIAIIAVAITLVVTLGLMVRLSDPLSTSVVPAEDPYTHMILVRSHVADGELDPVFPGGTLYPPGMHAVLAAAWAFTGLDLYEIFLFGPVVFGIIGVIGVALLAGRYAGASAAVIAGLAVALAPELIFRTTMMAPTALDLALLPFLFLCAAETIHGRRLWAIPTVVLLAFLMVSHPWVVAIVAPAILGWMIVSLFGPWWGGNEARIDAIGVAIVLAATGAAIAGAANICWDEGCGLRFDELELTESRAMDDIAWGIAAVSAVLATALIVFRRAVDTLQDRLERRPMHLTARLLSIPLIAAIVAAVVYPAVQAGMPEFVDLPRMFGWAMMGLAGLGLVSTFVLRNRIMVPMAGLAAVTLPFVIYNPFDSEYWPHRTAAYLGIAIVVLAGIGGAIVVQGLRWGARWAAAKIHKKGVEPSRSRIWTMGAIATVAGMLLTAGTVYAATPLEYEDGWYRLYPECEFDAMRQIAEEAEPDAVIIAGDWQAKLVMGAFAADANNVWYSWEMFAQEDRRAGTLKGLHLEGRDVIMVEDRYMREESRVQDTSFLHEDPWQVYASECGEGLPEPRLGAYIAPAVNA